MTKKEEKEKEDDKGKEKESLDSERPKIRWSEEALDELNRLQQLLHETSEKIAQNLDSPTVSLDHVRHGASLVLSDLSPSTFSPLVSPPTEQQQPTRDKKGGPFRLLRRLTSKTDSSPSTPIFDEFRRQLGHPQEEQKNCPLAQLPVESLSLILSHLAFSSSPRWLYSLASTCRFFQKLVKNELFVWKSMIEKSFHITPSQCLLLAPLLYPTPSSPPSSPTFSLSPTSTPSPITEPQPLSLPSPSSSSSPPPSPASPPSSPSFSSSSSSSFSPSPSSPPYSLPSSPPLPERLHPPSSLPPSLPPHYHHDLFKCLYIRQQGWWNNRVTKTHFPSEKSEGVLLGGFITQNQIVVSGCSWTPPYRKGITIYKRDKSKQQTGEKPKKVISFDPDIYISAIAPALNDKIFVAGDVREGERLQRCRGRVRVYNIGGWKNNGKESRSHFFRNNPPNIDIQAHDSTIRMVLVNGGGGRRGGGRGGEVGVTCSDDGYVRVWSLGSGVLNENRCVATYDGHNRKQVVSLSAQWEHDLLFSGSWSKSVCCHDLRTEETVISWENVHPKAVLRLASSSCGKIYTTCDDGQMRVLDLRFPHQQKPVAQVNFSDYFPSSPIASRIIFHSGKIFTAHLPDPYPIVCWDASSLSLRSVLSPSDSPLSGGGGGEEGGGICSSSASFGGEEGSSSLSPSSCSPSSSSSSSPASYILSSTLKPPSSPSVFGRPRCLEIHSSSSEETLMAVSDSTTPRAPSTVQLFSLQHL